MINPEHWEKRSDWEESALAILRRGHTDSQRPITPVQRLLRILIFPARGCAESWTVFWDIDSISRQQKCYVSYLRWHRDIDRERFGSSTEIPTEPKPTIEHKEMILEDSFVEGFLEKFKNASIPTLVMPESYPHDAPIDGTMCEIVLGGAFTLSLFRWYTKSFADEPPSEWKALGKAMRETLVSLQEAMDKK